ncbi:MAG: hypothetical protein IPP69_02140 [Flavobacteriales bacterium]|nr:hypothetical protein [Flavobacteriales bacterium]
MQLKSILFFAICGVFILISSLNSCYYDNEAYLYSSVNCTDTTYTYTGRIKAIVDQNCATADCHAGTNPSSNIGLETYDQVFDNMENGEFLCTIYQNSGCNPMPKNASKLDACALDAFTKWKERGYPEN